MNEISGAKKMAESTENFCAMKLRFEIKTYEVNFCYHIICHYVTSAEELSAMPKNNLKEITMGITSV